MSDYGFFDEYAEDTGKEDSSAEEPTTEEGGLPFASVEDGEVTYHDLTGEKVFAVPPRQNEDKRKVGYYLRNSVAERLDMVTRYLKETGVVESKSEVVELALRGLLQEVENRGDSRIKNRLSNE